MGIRGTSGHHDAILVGFLDLNQSGQLQRQRQIQLLRRRLDKQIPPKNVPVDTFEPNHWGLYQVHGNVREWVEDCWNDSNSGNPGNGSARTTGDAETRVYRGGCWIDDPRFLRAAFRLRETTDGRKLTVGFRVARTLTP
jgi:formylglycine-generating enzyme required for sulfatase activity